MATKAHLEGNKRYLLTQDDIRIRVPKGQKNTIKAAAEAQGKSLNNYIIEAIHEKMNKGKV